MMWVGDGFKTLALRGRQIEGAGLVATDHADGSGACALERNGKATPAREAPARGDGQDNWSLGQLVERGRGNDQYRAGALLFMAGSGIEADEPDVTRGSLQQLFADRLGVNPGAILGRKGVVFVALRQKLIE